MKRYFTRLLIACSLLMLTAFPVMAAETFTLDPEHTYVLWHINHLGYSTQTGKWMAEGTLQLDKAKPQDSKVNVTIKVGDIITGNPELDKHLKGKLFFNVEQFPTATFVSDKVDVTGKNTAKVKGILTVHGVSKPVVLNVKFNNESKNPISDKMTVGFSATAKIKRSDFGIVTLLPKLGDEIDLNIEAEAYLSS